MKKVLVATDKPFAKEAVDGIQAKAKAAGYEVILLEKYGTKDKLLAAVADVDAMIIRSDVADKEVIEAGKNLKIIVRAGAGFDNIDLNAATACNVVAMNTPGQNSNAVAELAIGLMIMAARNNYNGKSGSEIHGKKLGIYGYGNVGRLLGKYAMGFGMEVVAYDPFLTKEQIESTGAKQCTNLDDLFGTCHYISLHCPANDETKKSINMSKIGKMPKGATLINTARKEVIDEDDLKKILAERPDFKYMADVAPECAAELKENYADRVFFTPKKLGAQTEEANVNAGIAAINQIVDYFENGNERFRLNK
ncbi:MAG: 3-phosphoglycerate dehydrogenase [Bacteroidales bacterium]|nr:3-phosphoglycerate dehydrogenase [Bacteroidales bacterium]